MQVGGRDATLLVWSPDYDGKGKAWVRFDDGEDAIVGGSRVERGSSEPRPVPGPATRVPRLTWTCGGTASRRGPRGARPWRAGSPVRKGQ